MAQKTSYLVQLRSNIVQLCVIIQLSYLGHHFISIAWRCIVDVTGSSQRLLCPHLKYQTTVEMIACKVSYAVFCIWALCYLVYWNGTLVYVMYWILVYNLVQSFILNNTKNGRQAYVDLVTGRPRSRLAVSLTTDLASYRLLVDLSRLAFS